MVTVTGKYQDAAGGPASGWVSLTPDVSAAHDGVVVTQAPIVGELDSSGAFSVTVLASDDPAWVPGPMPYIITESVSGLMSGWMAYVNGPGPVDITELVPLPEAPVV